MKLGIVSEGGAIRTIFACGVLDAFLENDISCDYFIGTSAGAAFGVSYISKQHGRNLEIMEKYARTQKYMGMTNLINPKNRSYFDLKFVYEDIPNEIIPFDYETFRSFNGTCLACVTNLETGEPEYFPVAEPVDKHNTILKATCALPMMSPIVKYKGGLYLDGGVADSIPYKKALLDGCDKLIILLTREEEYVKKDDSILSLAKGHYKDFPNFCVAMETRATRYNEDTAEIKKLEEEGKVFVFRPSSTKHFKRNERNLTKIHKLYSQGYIEAYERLDELKEFLSK